MADQDQDNKPCPFCGAEVDPEGWMGHDERGPECEGCGATARTIEEWNSRIVECEVVYEALEAGGDALTPIPLGANPRDVIDFYAANPNLFRTLGQRLAEFAIYMKVSLRMMPDVPIEDDGIGPDVARASVLLVAMADVVEEGSDDD